MAAARRLDIQGLRGIAVLLVVLCHAAIGEFAGGFIGVDVFFVISGYVITQLLLRQPAGSILANLRTFYIRRVLRIVPAATLVLATTPLVASLVLGSYFDPELITDTRWAALFAANFRLISTSADYFVQGVFPSLITHFWSLAVEEQFYFFYPLLVFVISALAGERQRTLWLRTALIAGIGASAYWAVVETAANRVDAYYSPLTRFWELALGGLIATLPALVGRAGRIASELLAVSAVALLGYSLIIIRPESEFPGWLAWLPCAASAVLLWSGQSSTLVAKVLAVRPLTWLGDLSYSLYLWHYAWLFLPLQLEVALNSPLDRLWQVAGALLCAMASYYLVENPIRHSQRLVKDGFAVLLLLAVAIATVWDLSLVVEQLSLTLNR